MDTTEKDAIGERGFLIRGVDGTYYFRQYDENHDFVDYEITHHDMEIVIIDRSAALFRHEAGDFLDYSTESMTPTK